MLRRAPAESPGQKNALFASDFLGPPDAPEARGEAGRNGRVERSTLLQGQGRIGGSGDSVRCPRYYTDIKSLPDIMMAASLIVANQMDHLCMSVAQGAPPQYVRLLSWFLSAPARLAASWSALSRATHTCSQGRYHRAARLHHSAAYFHHLASQSRLLEDACRLRQQPPQQLRCSLSRRLPPL